MVISHKNRLIFWKPHKVGSTSVMVALGSQCGPQDCVGGMLDQGSPDSASSRRNMAAFSHLPTAGNHATPGQLRPIVEALWGRDLWRSYLKVTIIRNPWDRAVSWWDYANNKLGRKIPLSDALHNTERDYWFHGSEPWADLYLRYEHLADDYAALCNKLGLKPNPLPHLRSGTRDKQRPYWTYFDQVSRDRIARNFALELDHFGYRFGEAS